MVNYLENENQLNTDLSVKPPTQNVSKDVTEFKDKFSTIKSLF